MERVKLESFLDLDGLMVKPSIKDKLTSAMYKSQALTYGDFCKHSEAELLDIEFLTHDLYVALCQQVKTAGLHVNMTDKELEEYKDAEFVKNNPEVISPIFFLMIRRPPRSTLFPYTTLLPILQGNAQEHADVAKQRGDGDAFSYYQPQN